MCGKRTDFDAAVLEMMRIIWSLKEDDCQTKFAHEISMCIGAANNYLKMDTDDEPCNIGIMDHYREFLQECYASVADLPDCYMWVLDEIKSFFELDHKRLATF